MHRVDPKPAAHWEIYGQVYSAPTPVAKATPQPNTFQQRTNWSELDRAITQDDKNLKQKGLEDFLEETRVSPPLGGVGTEPILWSVTAADLELAAASGKSEAQIAARKAVAEAFYRVYTEPEDFHDAKIKQHLKGIDYTKPIKGKTITTTTAT